MGRRRLWRQAVALHCTDAVAHLDAELLDVPEEAGIVTQEGMKRIGGSHTLDLMFIMAPDILLLGGMQTLGFKTVLAAHGSSFRCAARQACGRHSVRGSQSYPGPSSTPS